MPTNISLKNVPDRLILRLRQRAAKHHRSLQGEDPARLTPSQILSQVRQLGLKTPREAVSIIRRDRNT
ncbi:MAG: hypothetical protein NPIRA01_07290 [Nitrospirales bacterium]|nr:MAG: hypothetical protein NPIRA01_07290 [Nitrospirales bacterium]